MVLRVGVIAVLCGFCLAGRVIDEEDNVNPSSMLQVGTSGDTGKILGEHELGEYVQEKVTQHKVTQDSSDNIVNRPHLGEGPEQVQVGVYVKDFQGMSLKGHSFVADLVLTVAWQDDRAVRLVPDGEKSVGLPLASAKGAIWLPQVEITNRAGKFDTISSTVTVTKNATIVQVDRLVGSLHCPFPTFAFPFDKQNLVVRLASTTLMSNDLVLSTIEDAPFTGFADGIWNNTGFACTNHSMQSYVRREAMLEKSRAELSINLERDWRVYFESLFIPPLLTLSVSWAGFFLPANMPPAMMPRIATSFISYLALVTFMGRVGGVVPHATTVAWVDVYMEAAMILIYAAVVFNVIVLSVSHKMKIEGLGETIDRELQIMLPLLAVISMGSCFLLVPFGISDGSTIIWLLFFTRSLLGGSLFGYGIWTLFRIKKSAADKQ